MKTLMMITILVLMTTMVKSEETYTPKEFATSVIELPGKVVSHVTAEIQETKDFQAKSWAEAKEKWPWNKIFKGEDNE